MYLWQVGYQYHTKDEKFVWKTMYKHADSIGEALNLADCDLNYRFETEKWSDYHVTSVAIVPELH